MRISDWSSDVCSSDLAARRGRPPAWLTAYGKQRPPAACLPMIRLRYWSATFPRCSWIARSGAWLIQRRSEEHTSELQSLMRISYAVFCLKKKKNNKQQQLTIHKLSTQCESTKTTTNEHTPNTVTQ